MGTPSLDHLAAFSSMLARDPDASLLTNRDLQFVATLCSHAGPIGLGTMADLLKLSHSHASRVADKLAGRGLITRTPLPTNRRILLLAPTEAGFALDHRVRRDFYAAALDCGAA